MKTAGLFISAWLCVPLAFSQALIEETVDVERIADELVPFPDDGASYDDAYDYAVQTLSSPMDLNSVTGDELKGLHILTDSQVESILSYRAAQGPFLDVYELQVVPGIDSAAITRLRPFIRLIDPASRVDKSVVKRIISPGHSYLVTRYERSLETDRASSVKSSAFKGSPDKLYFRLRSSMPGDFSFGITGEKDAGEQMKFDVRQHQFAFDFTSYHLQLKNKGRIKNVIAGDYQAQFGQGLILGGAFGLGKGGESVSTIRKANAGFQPYTSIHENAYQRGVAVTVAVSSTLDVSAFYSSTRRDASLSVNNDTLSLTSLSSTGYHRTENELSRRKTALEQNAGCIAHIQKRNLDAGVIANYILYDAPLKRTPALYNQFAFQGRANLNTGMFLNYRWQNISFFSEMARSQSGGVGALCGLLFSLDARLETAVLYRGYMRNFHTFYTNAFSENTQPQNERGVYWGWRYRWSRQYSFNGYVDLFTFPWLSFRRYAPSQGYEWLLRGSYQPSKETSIALSFREESKGRNLPDPSSLYKVAEVVRNNVSLHLDYLASRNIRLRSRIQYTAQQFSGEVTEGWAFVQDITVSAGRLRLSARHALFDTAYDTRQYVYETDAWSSYSLPAYSGVGVRNYVLFEYNLCKWMKFWVRYARTRLANDEETASEADSIDGNMRNDLKFQVRITF